VYLGRDRKGRVRHKSQLFRGTKRQAEKELRRLVVGQDVEPKPPPPEPVRPNWNRRTTINDAIEAWKRDGWDDLSPVTVRRYENVWQVHIKKTIGREPISTLSPHEVERYFRGLKAKGRGRETVRYVRSLLNRACGLARKWSGNELPNPILETELPNWDTGEVPEAVRAPTVDEVRALLICALELDLRYAVCLRVIAATGTRRGEACALRWSDIDWKGATLTIDESVIPSDGGAAIKSPRTRASIRQVSIDAGTLAALKSLRITRQELAADADVDLSEVAFVFSAEPDGGRPPYPDTVSRAFTKARKAARLPGDLRLHSLRYFQATSLDCVIPERQKQARLGWSTVQMARHSTEAISSEDKRAAEHIGNLLDS
jgi:integrase